MAAQAAAQLPARPALAADRDLRALPDYELLELFLFRAIPRGEVLTYGQVAKLIRSAPRAVGQACGANWFPVAIPCHRVTAAGGIGGFGGYALHDGGFHHDVKRWLLQHEQVPGY